MAKHKKHKTKFSVTPEEGTEEKSHEAPHEGGEHFRDIKQTKQHEAKQHEVKASYIPYHKKTKSPKYNSWKISTIILIVLLIAAIVFIVISGINTKPKTTIVDKTQVVDKAMNFINKNLLQGQALAVLKSTEKVGDLYRITIDINGREFSSYITLDGRYFFPQGVDIDAFLKNQTQQNQQNQNNNNKIPKTEKPSVMLFTMSFCPFGNQAEQAMKPVADLLKKVLDIEPHYVIYSNYRGGGPNYCLDNESKYCSMHGIQEVHQDVRELCVYKYDKDKYWDFVSSINTKCSASNVDSCWESVANDTGLNVDQIKQCQKQEAIDLLKQELALDNQYNVRASPTLIINGVRYRGSRTPQAFKQAICSAFKTEPDECSQSIANANNGNAPKGNCG